MEVSRSTPPTMAFTTTTFETIRADFLAEVEAGALVFCNHSGGKDSQAMYLLLRDLVPADQLVIIHADLGDRVEWGGVQDHIRATIDGRELLTEKAVDKQGNEKDLLDNIERRQMWPSPAIRQCTSDFKTTPLMKLMRRVMKERGATRAINCMGLRAEESANRAKKAPWKLNAKMSVAGRTVFDCLPILSMLEQGVFGAIAQAGQEVHWAYKAGMSRLSCCFCIMASQADLQTAAKLRPELAQQYVDLEARIGHTFTATKSLAEIIGVQPTAALVAA